MTRLSILAGSLLWGILFSPLVYAGEMSTYREIDLNSGLLELAKQKEMRPDEVKTIHDRPALIQEFKYRTGVDDSVENILFRFYEGQLYRMTVFYDRYKTEGLTAEDIVEATSAIYGEAQRPVAEITFSSKYGSSETLDVIARWEDEDWSFNLVRFQPRPDFALAVFSKRLDAMAQVAADEAIRLDLKEAPQRKIDQKRKDDATEAAEQEENRRVNKPLFRP